MGGTGAAGTEGIVVMAGTAAVDTVVEATAAGGINPACFLYSFVDFFSGWLKWFLQGGLRILVCFWMVICGDFVVICVVERVGLMVTFQCKKTRHCFQLYFLSFPIWELLVRL